MPYNPRAPMMAPAQQFPAQPLMDPQSQAMLQRRMLGGVPQGLLDTSNAPAGLLGPPTVRPGAAAGLLTPIIWNRLQQQLGLTEGARAAEGGGRGYQPALDLRGGQGTIPPDVAARAAARVAPQPTKLDWRSYFEGQTHRTTTKSGLRVIMDKSPHEDGTVEVTFLGAPGMERRSSTGKGIDKFSEVFGAVKDYVQGFRPDRLKFTGLSEKHDMLYEKVAPRVADALGGKLMTPKKGNFVIDLTGAK